MRRSLREWLLDAALSIAVGCALAAVLFYGLSGGFR